MLNLNLKQRCHDPGLTSSDPDPSSTDLTLIDGVMMGQGSVRISICGVSSIT
jgi:hypothetical protein